MFIIFQNYFLPFDVEQIVKIRASPQLGEDVLVWEPEKVVSSWFKVLTGWRWRIVFIPHYVYISLM